MCEMKDQRVGNFKGIIQRRSARFGKSDAIVGKLEVWACAMPPLYAGTKFLVAQGKLRFRGDDTRRPRFLQWELVSGVRVPPVADAKFIASA